jgi:hypothetical protein
LEEGSKRKVVYAKVLDPAQLEGLRGIEALQFEKNAPALMSSPGRFFLGRGPEFYGTEFVAVKFW